MNVIVNRANVGIGLIFSANYYLAVHLVAVLKIKNYARVLWWEMPHDVIGGFRLRMGFRCCNSSSCIACKWFIFSNLDVKTMKTNHTQ